MGALEKAELQALSPAAEPTTVGEPIKVQFNPSSMRLQMTNNVEGGKSRGRQVQQYNGTSSTVLSLDLVFDTADEGTTDRPRNVREKTSLVSQFVLPAGRETKQAPPRVRFHWGDFVFDGVMTSLTEDIDLFSSGGVPVRAKLSVSIKEQDPKFEALQSGAGASTAAGATDAGANRAAPGTSGGGPTNRTAFALGGESAADFTARMGLDPSAWRGVAAGLGDSLSLQAGTQIDFSADLSVSAGVGASAGVEVGASVSIDAAVGLETRATLDAAAAAGFALSAVGGVEAAIQTAAAVKTESAAAQARSAFDLPRTAIPARPARAASTGRPVTLGLGSLAPGVAAAVSAAAQGPSALGPPEQPRPPLRLTGIPSPSVQAVAPPAPAPPRADPRAVGYGLGVPLRPRVTGAADERQGAVAGRVVVGPRPKLAGMPAGGAPGAVRGVAWPPGHRDGRPATSTTRSCGCGGGGRP
jgi:hypothetical protein